MAPGDQPRLTPPPSPTKSKVPWIVGGCAVLLLAVLVLGIVGGYLYYRWPGGKPTNQNSNGGPQNTPTASPGDSKNNSNQSSPAAPDAAPSSWAATASTATPETSTLTQVCSAGGDAHTVWGSDIYTADSSICTAAVHAGLITFAQGGTVTIELRPGRPVYGSTERNGVTTNVYGAFHRSFIFSESAETKAADVTPILWETVASLLTFEAGKTYKFKCPVPGRQRSVWGTDVYTADSSICTAAAHVGKITLENGGAVTIELRPGEKSYQGTTRNNVKTNDYGEYGQSFVVR